MKKTMTRIGFAALILLAGYVTYDYLFQDKGETAAESSERINQEIRFGPTKEQQIKIDAQRAR